MRQHSRFKSRFAPKILSLITNYFDQNYIQTLFKGQNIDISEMAYKSKFGFNNELNFASNIIISDNYSVGHGGGIFLSAGANINLQHATVAGNRVGEGDVGPNTGGMGAYAPAPVITESVRQRAIKEIVNPMHHHLRNQAIPYRGVLYVGLMIDDEGAPSVVEYNVRFGDPECQVIIPRLRNDLLELITQVKNQSLCDVTLKWDPNFAITVVMSSEGYPEYYENGYEIIGLEDASKLNNVVPLALNSLPTNLNSSKLLISLSYFC